MKNYLHPLLFALFPALFLYAYNIGELQVTDVLVPSTLFILSLVILLTVASVAFLGWLLKNKSKGALCTTFFLALFFSYGHLNNFLEQLFEKHPIFKLSVGSVFIGPNKYQIFFYSILLIGGCFLIIRARGHLDKITSVFNVLTSTLLLICLVQVGSRFFKRPLPVQKEWGVALASLPLANGEAKDPSELPNIFCIVLDAYANETTLRELYDYDNGDFTRFLESKGFFVAKESFSNYGFTFLSFPSFLNMEYLDYLPKMLGYDAEEKTIPFKMIRNNKVVQFLKKYGYKFVLFPSGWDPTDHNHYADIIVEGSKWSDSFSVLFLRMTILKPFIQKFFREDQRKRTLESFAMVPLIDQHVPGPKFVLFHSLISHPPFLFGPNGEETPYESMKLNVYGDTQKYKSLYLDQLRFATKKTKELIQRILAESKIDPIIVLLSDHGPEFSENWQNPSENFIKEHMRILNAFYVPETVRRHLYPQISPVNNFRVIFKYLFNADMNLLQDRSYFSYQETQLNFIDVTSLVSQ